MVRTGLRNLLDSPPLWMNDKRLGLLFNPASVLEDLEPAHLALDKVFSGMLKALFTPQHGFFAARQDNMVESDHRVDPHLNIPAYSLYSRSRRPAAEMFADIDVLLVDIQDAGTRVYTFMYTMAYCMEAARDAGITVCVLDRPNPIGGVAVEGNILKSDCASFVGEYPIPMRHGLTMGELARLFNTRFEIGCELEVIPMTGWSRSMYFEDTGLIWVQPSPNLPAVDSAVVYPGQVIWEGTNISEGRGTTRPFELFGAPFIDPDEVMEHIREEIPGALIRKCAFQPSFNKWAGEFCGGFQIHVTDRGVFKPYLASLRFLSAVANLYPGEFSWKEPPYEYELERRPIDLIIGDKEIRRALEQGQDPHELEEFWQDDLNRFLKASRPFHLYE